MTPLKVVGVGHDPQLATHDYTLPISLRLAESQGVSSGTITTPVIANSDLPGLLGLGSLRENRAIIDFGTQRLYFAGSGEYNLNRALPPESSSFQCELAPSGHLVLPCCDYNDLAVTSAVEAENHCLWVPEPEAKSSPEEHSAVVAQSRTEAVSSTSLTNVNNFQ